MTEQQTKPQMIILVSPSGSQVVLADAIKSDFINWQIKLVPVPEPQTNGAQPETMTDGNNNSDS